MTVFPKNKTNVFLIANFRIYKLIDSLSPMILDHQIALRETLIENNVYLLNSLSEKANSYFFVHKLDVEIYAKKILTDNFDKVEIEFETAWDAVKSFIEERSDKPEERHLIVFANSIGYDVEKINYIINLLENDDKNAVIFRSFNGKISLLGFNHLPSDFFENLPFVNLFYDDTLAVINKTKNFLFSLNGAINVDSFEEFSELYKMLRLKESKKFCPDHIYEKFANLFIEYKEHIKK